MPNQTTNTGQVQWKGTSFLTPGGWLAAEQVESVTDRVETHTKYKGNAFWILFLLLAIFLLMTGNSHPQSETICYVGSGISFLIAFIILLIVLCSAKSYSVYLVTLNMPFDIHIVMTFSNLQSAMEFLNALTNIKGELQYLRPMGPTGPIGFVGFSMRI
jgi:hypothetical protein